MLDLFLIEKILAAHYFSGPQFSAAKGQALPKDMPI